MKKTDYENLIALHNNPNIPSALCNVLKVKNEDVDYNYISNLRTLANVFNNYLIDLPTRDQEVRPAIVGFLNQIKEKLISLTNADKDLSLDKLCLLAVENVKAKVHQLIRVVTMFKKIYRALYDGESNFFKDADFLAGKENMEIGRLYKAIYKDDSTRTRKALELAVKFYDSDSCLSNDIFNEVYEYSFSNSGPIKKSNLTGVSIFRTSTLKQYTPLEVNEYYALIHPTSRTAKIINALR